MKNILTNHRLKTIRFNWLWLAGFLALLTFIYLVWLNGRQWRRFGWIEIGENRYHVVYARSANDRQQGLSDRTEIGADAMVFINPEREQSQFWMYNMQFPLDFVWVADGKVVDLHENVDIPGEQEIIMRVSPNQPVDMVIEFPSGTIDRENIIIGTPVERVLNWYYSLW